MENEIKTLTYEMPQIEKMLNLLNQLEIKGIRQAQIITQVVSIIDAPVTNNVTEIENK